jgi:peptidoglycan/xylan/chitin deacetylase (PgdA/CDA1 family)
MGSPGQLDVTRIVKCAISLAVFAASRASRFFRILTGRKPAGSCVILYYHSVPPEQRGLFAAQLEVILHHCRPVDVTGLVHLQPGVDFAGITFDDAFENFFEQAFPELQKRNIPSTMFVISAALGKGFGPVNRTEKVMSVSQLCSLPQNLVSIGSHTVSHPFLPSLTEQQAFRELVDSKATLEKILQREITTFSFPFGGFSPALVENARRAGYRRVFTTLPEFAFATDSDPFLVGRVRVDPTDWPIEFRLKLAGAYRWLPLAFALKRKFRGAITSDATEAKPAAERSMVREWSGS